MNSNPQQPGPEQPGTPPPAQHGPSAQPPGSGPHPPVYPGGGSAPERRKKPWFKKWWVWLLVVIGLVAIGGAIGGGDLATQQDQAATTSLPSRSPAATGTDPTPTTSSQPVEQPKDDLTLDDGWTMSDSDGIAVYVEGYVSNNTDRDIASYVQITFDALDANGANLGTCLDNTNTVDAGGKWKFKAVCLDNADEIATVRFKDISGY